MCNQSTWSNLWNCIRRTYLTIKNIKENFIKYLLLGEFRIQRQNWMIRSNVFIFLWNFSLHTNIKNQNDGMHICIWSHRKTTTTFFATKHMWKAEKIKKITYPRKGTCVCKHLFIRCPAVFQKWNIHCDTALVNILKPPKGRTKFLRNTDF